MKKYIKTVLCGVIIGACFMQLTNMAVQSWLDRPMSLGGEILLPALLGMVGYMGWQMSSYYFNKVKYKKIYKKGFDDGTKIHSYRIIVPLDETDQYEAMNSRSA